MPFATNALDGVRVYFEDTGTSGPPVLYYAGFMDPLEVSKASGLARALSDEFRLVFADHRGHGRSDKPHDVEAYDIATRCADATAVLDELGLERSHFFGNSWGARLGFALGVRAPERFWSMALCGNQPYEWDPKWPFVPMLTAALDATTDRGIDGFVAAVEAALEHEFDEQVRAWLLDNDPAALRAAWTSTLAEGPVSDDLSSWRLPCLIYLGADDAMHDAAQRAASEMPNARFLSLTDQTHLDAWAESDAVVTPVRELFRAATPT